MQESYLNKVDMIYIDPPYNTGHDFIYHDNFRKTQSDEIDDSRDDDGDRQYVVNSKENGRYHSDWLSMMYPRLKLARNLLSACGVFLMSIDDNELSNGILLCDEVFGEDNKRGVICWQKKTQPSFLSKTISNVKEYLLLYTRNSNYNLKTMGGLTDADKPIEMINISNSVSERTLPKEHVVVANGNWSGYLKKGVYGRGSLSISLDKDVFIDNGIPDSDVVLDGRFKWTQDKINESIENGSTIHIKNISSLRPTVCRNSSEVNIKPILDLFSKKLNDEIPTNTDATNEIKSMFEGVSLMDYPKPSKLIKYLIRASTYDNKSAIILDFFAGSGTTAHAVMKLNAEDGGHRKFIMVQLDEKCDEKSEAYKAGYKTIDQLSRERIRRAAKQIKETDKNAADHDYGFRALYVDKSNVNDDVFATADVDRTQLQFQVNNIRNDRSPLDLLFGVLVAKGWQLDGKVEERQIGNNVVYLYDYLPGAGMVSCFDENLDSEIVDQIINMHPNVAVFRESSFNKSSDKLNLMERFKNDSLETSVWVI